MLARQQDEQFDPAQLRELFAKYRDHFPLFAEKHLKIATKSGRVEPLKLNSAQKYVHDRLEQQLFEEGQVRALIVKGRQQGVSTYVEGRYYHKTRFRRGVNAFILTHLQEATDNLFEMVGRYHEYMLPLLKPLTATDSAKELKFKSNDSSYRVSTAGSKATGRSRTIHYFHGSEVAYWDNAETHAAGVMQAIPDGNDTEIILESTANGVGGYFHEQWQKAERGESDFIAIFVPWFWQEEYRTTPKEGWTPSDSEQQYMDLYGLEMDQVYWMHRKNIQLGGDPGEIGWLFLQEYPFCATDAFQVSGEDSICDPQRVVMARKVDGLEKRGAHIIGVDPARYGDDRSSWIHRQGRVAWALKSRKKNSTTELAGWIAREVDHYDEIGEPIDAIMIDVVGLGAGTVDALNDLGYSDRVIEVDAGSKALDPEQYLNLRVEMWDLMGDWFDSEVSIPDKDSIQADLVAPQYTYNVKQQKVLETKEQMKKRGIRSPDEGEALALTFAMPIRPKHDHSPRKEQDWRTL